MDLAMNRLQRHTGTIIINHHTKLSVVTFQLLIVIFEPKCAVALNIAKPVKTYAINVRSAFAAVSNQLK
jgi:hypothetical protein